MKIVLISDTHNRHSYLTSKGMGSRLPDGDLLIHAGDLTGIGSKGEVQSALEWLLKQAPRYTHGIVFIAGNHDKSFDPKFNIEDATKSKKPEWLCDILSDFERNSSRVHYLENNHVIIEGVKIWGSPITPWFHGDYWAFNKYRGEDIREVWQTIPNDTNIIVTHGPVAYKCDFIPSQLQSVGCLDLDYFVKKVKPLIHVSGHIHESYGYAYDEHTNYFNASILDEYYQPENKPWELEISWKNKEINII